MTVLIHPQAWNSLYSKHFSSKNKGGDSLSPNEAAARQLEQEVEELKPLAQSAFERQDAAAVVSYNAQITERQEEARALRETTQD